MAERSVYWRIVTNFSKARKDSDQLADSLERLQDQTEELDETSASGAKEATKSRRTLGQAIKEQARRVKEATAAQKADNLATQQGVAATEELIRAQERLARAQNARQAATLGLQAAQARLAAAEAKHGANSAQYAAALLSVQRRQNDVAASSDRYAASLRRVEMEQKRANAGAQTAVGMFGRMGGAARRAANDFANVPKAMGGMLRGLPILAGKMALVTAGIGYLISGLSGLTAGLMAITGPILSSVQVLGTLPQALSVAAGAIGTFVAAFSGVGDALKAGMAVQSNAGKSARDMARQTADAADQIERAQRGVRDAYEAAGDAARNGARAIRDASRQILDAQIREFDATTRLTEARREARREMEDMARGLRDLALQERGASLSVEEARRRLQETLIDPGADDLAKRQAQLAYDEAVARMDDVRKEKREADKQYKDAQKKGVEGSDAVVEAQMAQIAATEGLRDAQEALADAQREAARANRDAAEGIADAKDALADARQAARDLAVEGSADMQKFQQSMESLSPAGRRFVQTLMGMRDEMRRLKFAAQEGLLPGLGEALTTMLKLVPLAERGLFMFGQTIANVAKKAADRLTSPEFMPMWERLLISNNRLLKIGGDAFVNLLETVVYLMDGFRPLTEWLAEVVLGWTEYWKGLAKARSETTKAGDTFARLKDTLSTLGNIFKNLWDTFKGIGRAGKDLGDDLLKSFERITKGWSDWANSPKGQNELKAWFDAARPVLHEFSGLLGDLTRMFFDLGTESGDETAKLINAIRRLIPPFQKLMENLTGDFGLAVVDLFESVANALIKLTDSGSGGFTAFVKTLTTFFDVLGWLLDQPVLGTVIKTIAIGLGVMAGLKFTGLLAGIRGIFKMLGKGAGMWARLFPNSRMVQRFGNRSRRELVRAGGSMAAGLVRGWAAGIKPFVARIATDMTRVIAAAKRRLGIKSPSTVFIAIGQMIAQGLIRGMRMMTAPVAAASASMTGAAVVAGRQTARGAGRRSGGKTAKGGGRGAGKKAGGSAKADGGTGKLAKGAGKAGGAVEGLALALSFLPGRVGEVASKFLMLSLVVSAVAPLLSMLGKGFLKMLGIVGKVLGSVGRILMKFVGVVAKALMLIGRAMLANPWMLLVVALVVVVVLIVKHWDTIKKYIVKAINWIKGFVAKVWGKIKDWFGPPLMAAWRAIKRVWELIKAGIRMYLNAYKAVILFIWGKIKDWLVKPLQSAWEGVKKVWDKIKDGFSTGATKIKDAFISLKDGIASAWGKIKSLLGKPVEFVVNTVINKWLLGNINKVLGGIGLDSLKIPEMPEVHFARGGKVPGEGNRDSVRAMLMPGEFVLRKGAVKSIGVSQLEAMNEGRSFRGKKRFASGGQVGDIGGLGGDLLGAATAAGNAIKDTVTSAAQATWGSVKAVGGKVVDLAKVGAQKGLSMLFEPVRGMLGRIPGDNIMSKTGVGTAKKLMDAAVAWIGGAGKAAPAPDAASIASAAAAGAMVADTGPNSPGGAQAYARSLMSRYGWSGDQMNALITLWNRESNWRWNADNPTSSAYGIPQALPGRKMASAGADWATNARTQVRWGMGYIRDRYGSPRSALSFHDRMNWYRRGGKVRKFARGGRMDELAPAMLTPGEFVFNREAVSRIGLNSLNRMNRSGVQRFHRGGPVLGVTGGGRGLHIKALEYIAGVGTDGRWDPALATRLRDPRKLNNPSYAYDPPVARDNAFISWLKAAKVRARKHTPYKNPKRQRVGDILKSFFGGNYAKKLKPFLDINNFYRSQSRTTTTPGTAGGPGKVWPTTFRSLANNYPGHTGVDITLPGSADYGKPVYATQAGVARGYDLGNRSFGKYVRIDHGAVDTIYAHLSKILKTGRVGTGEKIGLIGSTGNSTGPHLHFEVRPGGTYGSALRYLQGAGDPRNAAGGTAPTTNTTTTRSGRYTLNSVLPAGMSMKIPKTSYLGARSWGQALKTWGVSSPQLTNWISQIGGRIQREASAGHKGSILGTYYQKLTEQREAFTALNKTLGLPTQRFNYGAPTKAALAHVLNHTYGRAHDDFAPRPWQHWTPLEASILTQQQLQAKQQQWQSSLNQIASWGFNDLLDHLFETGMDDGLQIATEASKNRHLAERLNKELGISRAFNEEDLRHLIKMVGFLTANAGKGLRDTARHLGLSDLQTVLLWEKGVKAGKFNTIPTGNKSKMITDVASYRKGTFYANTGGQVPGSGSTDTVPAMLTPGEFVLRKEAAKALGLQNLWALNNLQKFNSGGLVMAPGVSSIPNVATTGVSARRLGGAGGVVYTITNNYDVDIINPVAERSSKSITKGLQRLSVVGGTGNTIKKGG